MTDKEIKHLYEQEKFILENIRLENNACKGCKKEALKHHVMLLDVISFIIEQRLWELIK